MVPMISAVYADMVKLGAGSEKQGEKYAVRSLLIWLQRCWRQIGGRDQIEFFQLLGDPIFIFV